MSRRLRSSTRVFRSSTNVFLDLGVAQSEVKETKVRLAAAVSGMLRERGLTQHEAARLLQIGQPKVSALVNYRLGGFSVERLIQFLNTLGCRVEIVVHPPRPRRTGKTIVTAA